MTTEPKEKVVGVVQSELMARDMLHTIGPDLGGRFDAIRQEYSYTDPNGVHKRLKLKPTVTRDNLLTTVVIEEVQE